MKVYRELNDFIKLSNAIVTTGTYDGVHKGHRKILQTLTEIAKKNKGESVVITFWPHPRKIIGTGNLQDVKSLSTLEEKIDLLSSRGIDHLLIIPFNREFSELSSQDFIKNILQDTIGTKKLIIGYDHKFGKNREGSFDYLQKESIQYGFEVEEIPRQDLNDIAISSTEIRNALNCGNVSKATLYLEQPYQLKGIVVKGKQLGRTIGFPTANIKVNDPEKLIPADGVYAVRVKYKNELFGGMLNIGYRPTVEGKDRTIEVYIIDFTAEIYGEELEVYFLEFIRTEQKFSSIEELKEQLKIDESNVRSILSKNNY
ncbi:MAG TPA: bifunctional riboflavin kinase/FAD synthetase [Cytophagaceae bacterium]|nr:bifunctional riboflavin kinase/FAD synthetase [Cytophagaceae bacterium]